MEVLREGYRIPFHCPPPLSTEPIPMPSYNPSSTKGVALEEVTLDLIAKGAVELAPLPSLRLLQPSVRGLENLRVVASGHRSPDPQSLRGCVTLPDGDHSVSPPFRPSGRLDGLHRSSGSLLAGSGTSGIASLPPLCGLWPSISVQGVVFRPIHGPAGFHTGHGSCFCHPPLAGYPLASLPRRLARESLLRDLQVVLDLCRELGIVVNPEKSNLLPSQVVLYLGVVLNTQSFLASPSPDHISRLLSTAGEFLSSASPPASVWLSAGDAFLHGSPRPRGETSHEISSALPSLVLGSGGPVDSCSVVHGLPSGSAVVAPPASSISGGISPPGVSGLGHLVRRLGCRVGCSSRLSHRFRPLESRLPINARELLAVRRGLLHFQSSLLGKTVAVFCDNITAVAYLRKEGGTRSPFLNSLAQGILRWSESLHIRLAPQFIPGSRNVLADALSRPHQLPSSEWSLNLEVFLSLRRRWPVQIDLFATSENHRCSIYFSPIRDPQSAGTDAFLQSWDGLQAYAFPPWSIIPRVLAKLQMSRGTELTLVAPYWPQRP